jgi:hypothetical protein
LFSTLRRPSPTKRLRCVFEVFAALATTTEVTILMNSAGTCHFLRDLREPNFLEIYRRMLADIRTDDACITAPAEDTYIRELIFRKLPKGFFEIDHLVVRALEVWINNMVAKELVAERVLF